MIELDKFEEHLNTISKKEWKSLFDLLPEIKNSKKFGEMIDSKLQDDGSYSFPYWSWSEIVTKTFDSIALLNLTPVFDWMNWEEGREILADENYDYSTLDIITLCKLLTCIIRLDRFSEGNLVANFENGTMQKIISNLNSKMKEEPILYSKAKRTKTKFNFLNLFKKN